MSNRKAIRTTLITLATIAVFIALACTPDGQGNPKPTPETTQQSTNAPIPDQLDPETLPESIFRGNLQGRMERFEATKEAHERSGRSAETLEDPYLTISIGVHTAENVDQLVEWLADKPAYIEYEDRTPHQGFGIAAQIRWSLLKDLSELEWIKSLRDEPGASLNQSNPSSSRIDLNEAQGITAWHDADITGAGVEVGIIDAGFENFSTNVTPNLAQTPSALCFRPGEEPTNVLSDCESFTDHGTKVAEQLLNVAPGAQIYISNARDQSQLRQAVNWMTAKTADNVADYEPTPEYTATSNDAFNIKIINHSASYQWDGPGDGTSPNPNRMYSPINSSNDAIANGALWVNAAGNAGQTTWFSNNVSYHNDKIDFDPGPDTDTCNNVDLTSGETYTFQVRWKGPWGGADNDLNLRLYEPRGQDGLVKKKSSTDRQNGEDDHYPTEIIIDDITTTGRYCLEIQRRSENDSPDWVQLQITIGEAGINGFEFNHPQLLYSIKNPAENDNIGLLAVGEALAINEIAIEQQSARGPIPEPNQDTDTKPDVVSLSGSLSTSFAAPRVAGMAALYVQAVGDTFYTSPGDIAQYIRNNAAPFQSGQGHFITVDPTIQDTDPGHLVTTDPNNHWGHGLATFHKPAPPTNLVLEHQPCNRDQRVRLTYDHTTWEARHDRGDNIRYKVTLRNTSPQTTGPLIVTTTHFTTLNDTTSKMVMDGNAYEATVETCSKNSLNCGPPSEASNTVTISREICPPKAISLRPVDK